MVDARSVTNRIEDGSDTFISVHDQMSCYGCRDSRSVIRRSVTGSPAKPRSQRSPPRPRWVPQKQHETGICGPANERCWCAPGACLRQWEDAKKGLVGGGARRPRRECSFTHYIQGRGYLENTLHTIFSCHTFKIGRLMPRSPYSSWREQRGEQPSQQVSCLTRNHSPMICDFKLQPCLTETASISFSPRLPRWAPGSPFSFKTRFF